MDQTEFIIEMLGITKDFPGVRANDGVTLTLRRGEIHALLGENGAGKSTLMSVLFGLYEPNAGVIKKDGKAVRVSSPNAANALGIGMVHQHFKLVHNFTALENIVLGFESVAHGVLKMDDARKRVTALSERYGLMVNVDAKIEDITVGMQQRVEILKMLYRDNEVLIFDEPTAVLTPQEIEELMKIMKGLAAEGKSILFITHKLNEIKAAADRCTVLRKGRCVGTVDVRETTPEQMSMMMVGRPVDLIIDKGPASPTEPALTVERLSVIDKAHGKRLVNDVSFTVRRGEIVCVAGIDGNGQSELAYALTGLMRSDSGKISLKGTDITNAKIRLRNDMGLSHIPEDRHKHGLVLDYTLAENMILKSYHKPEFQRRGFLRFKRMRSYTHRLIEQFDIRAGQGEATPARSMSGGNQQKAIVARELSLSPDLLIAVQPTRGLDVGAIEYIHKQLIDARDQNRAVLMISLELDEVMNLPDRILVMFEGDLVADVSPDDITIEELGLYMAGSKREAVAR